MIVGSRVMVKNRNNQPGTIRSVQAFGGVQFFEIMLDSGLSITEVESNLMPEMQILSPLDLFKQANFQSKNIYAVISAMNKLKSGHTNIIASLKASKTEFFPYQFKPLLKFLNSPNRKILIADEVGLGKTIEAGYILTEMTLRDLVRNCLVICKSSLKQKWANEMKQKFGFDFKIYSRKDLIESIKEDAGQGIKSVFGIINYDYRQTHSDEFIKTLGELDYTFDLLIVDEAHILRNAETIKHQAVKEIMARTEYSVFMTATPIMTSVDNLYNLVRLVEPNYEEYSLFHDHLALSRPFIEAIKHLNENGKPSDIIDQLKNQQIALQLSMKDGKFEFSDLVTVEERFKEDELFIETAKLARKEPFEHEDFVKLQFYLSELNSFHPIITRTRKREIQKEVEQVVRDVQLMDVDLNGQEAELYNKIMEDFEGEPLALIQRKRQAASCLPAFIIKYDADIAANSDILSNDSKFVRLVEIANQIVKTENKKLIIFSFFKSTLDYLQDRLRDIGINCLRIDGDVPINDRQSIIQKFETLNDSDVLLSSEVGSEGLDMQFCDHLVNYDLPWNPMVVEQRIGRIDRVGQKSKIIHIYNFYLSGTIEEEIVSRLFARIDNFQRSLGLLEDILSTDESVFENENNLDLLEKKIYGSKLTAAAKEKLLQDAERAIENAKMMKEKISNELDNSFVSDLFINDQIKSINREKRYITPEDIKQLLALLFRNRLATVRCDFEAKDPYIRWGAGDSTLFDFIETNLPSRSESPYFHSSFLSFKKKNRRRDNLKCTFSQEVAYINKELEFLSATHPLVQAALHYFRFQKMDVNKAFAFQIAADVLNKIMEPGVYVLANYLFELQKKTITKDLTTFFDFSIGFEFDEIDQTFSLLPEEKLHALIDSGPEKYTDHLNVPTEGECRFFADKLMPILGHSILQKRRSIEEEEKKLHLSRQYRLIDTEIDYLNRKLQKDDEQLRRSDSQIRRIVEDRIKKNTTKVRELERQKAAVDLTLTESLQSITFLEIT
jgi:SNF2 family DNA or RNA helicase